MATHELWEAYAERCIQIACQTRDTVIKEKLIEMARRCVNMAAEEEAPSDQVVSAHRPVAH